MISILIPTYNRSEILKGCLKRLADQKFGGRFEVIICDDGSTKEHLDAIVRLKDQYSFVKQIIRQKHRGPAAGRNKMIKISSGNILIFINDDTFVGKNFLEDHLDFHKKNQLDNVALIGSFVTPKRIINNGLMLWLVQDSHQHFCENQKSDWVEWYKFWTCNLSVKKKFLVDNSLYFDEEFKVAAWEDVELGYRAHQKGLKIFFEKDLVAYHYHQFNIDSLLNRFYAHGVGLKVLSNKLPYRYLPPLAKKGYRLIAYIIYNVVGGKFTEKSVMRIVKKGLYNNILMQYLIVCQKLRGWNGV